MTTEKRIEHQQKLANKLLDDVSLLDPDAIVAGGAPRDWYFDKEATDIDLFLSTNEMELSVFCVKIGRVLGVDVKTSNFNCGEFMNNDKNYFKNPDIRWVLSIEIEGEKVQIVVLHRATSFLIDTFPFDICKIWWKKVSKETPEGVRWEYLHPSKEFLKSVENKELKITNKLYANEDAYIQKIISKFPEFTFVEGDGYDYDGSDLVGSRFGLYL